VQAAIDKKYSWTKRDVAQATTPLNMVRKVREQIQNAATFGHPNIQRPHCFNIKRYERCQADLMSIYTTYTNAWNKEDVNYLLDVSENQTGH
jgi:DNA-directed RNA polymerase subunit F